MEYKFRAECVLDVFRFIEYIGDRYESFTVNSSKLFPDVTASLRCSIPLETLKSILKNYVVDGHVMLETIQPIDQYTGERIS